MASTYGRMMRDMRHPCATSVGEGPSGLNRHADLVPVVGATLVTTIRHLACDPGTSMRCVHALREPLNALGDQQGAAESTTCINLAKRDCFHIMLQLKKTLTQIIQETWLNQSQ